MFLWNPFEILDQSASFYLLNDTLLLNKRKCLYLALHILKSKKKILHWFWIALKSSFLHQGLWKAGKEVNFYRFKDRDISHKNLDFWLLGTLGRCGMEGPCPAISDQPLAISDQPLAIHQPPAWPPNLAQFPQFCNIPGPWGCLGTQVYMNSRYHMSPSIALFIFIFF